MKFKLLTFLLATLILSVTCFTNISFAFTPQEMDAEYQKSEEAKKNNNWSLAKDIVEPLAEKGHAKSQGRLGGIYLYGFGGVPKDLKKAFKWLKLGAVRGGGGSDVITSYIFRAVSK